jgi:alkanesulfonate monooxygenase SsuD/methylene tetrahydromethanopterin reductase-like flavin-dependent oxidoreductase (luciferase family)
MRIGVVLPTFRATADEARTMAATAAELGIDGVFAYDHLYPMGSPKRPALAPFPILARVAVDHPGLFVGTLVARVGLVDTDVLAAQFAALDALSPGHVICAAGTGDRLSAQENVAWGVPVGTAAERRGLLEELAVAQIHAGREVWIGGGAPATLEMAERIGATVNLWDAAPEQVAAQVTRTSTTWAGPFSQDEDDRTLADLLGGLDAAGATWAVFGGAVDLVRLSTVSGRQARDH